MTFDHRATTIHRADLDQEIESIRHERLVAAAAVARSGSMSRIRLSAGRLLIAGGTALLGREAGSLRTDRA